MRPPSVICASFLTLHSSSFIFSLLWYPSLSVSKMLRLFILDRECNTHLTHFRCSAMTHTQHPDSVNNKELYEVVCFYLFSYRWVWKTDSTMLSGVWPGVQCGLLTLLWAHLYIEHKAADQRKKKRFIFSEGNVTLILVLEYYLQVIKQHFFPFVSHSWSFSC